MQKKTKDHVILVDESDNQLGIAEKLSAHRRGLLHRAFSILIFNDKNEMLIQKRTLSKYHSGGLWTNACCSHQQLDQPESEFIHSRLMQELGIDCQLNYQFKFIYKHAFANGLIEHELDSVYTGSYNGKVPFNRAEVSEIKWIGADKLKKEMAFHPNEFTFWFKEIMKQLNAMDFILNQT